MRLLTTVTASLSVALENARLFDETRQRRPSSPSSTTSARRSRPARPGAACTARRREDARDVLGRHRLRRPARRRADRSSSPTTARTADPAPGRRSPIGPGLTSKILAIARARSCSTGARTGRPSGSAGSARRPRPISACRSSSGEQAIGVISVQSTKVEDRFGADDVRLLSTLAASVGTAIQNARLYQETHRRAPEMAALADVGREISANLDLTAVLERHRRSTHGAARRGLDERGVPGRARWTRPFGRSSPSATSRKPMLDDTHPGRRGDHRRRAGDADRRGHQRRPGGPARAS